MKRLARGRLLPATIFAAILMLTVKVNGIWGGVDGFFDQPVRVAGAVAQQPAGGERLMDDGEIAKTPESTAAQGDSSAEFEAEEQMVRQLTADDPTLLTQAEIDLLQQLAGRREELDGRARELAMREDMLKAAEERIKKRIGELKSFQTTIEKLVQAYNQQQDQKLLSLVKIYENMKPKDAALIFQELDMDTLLMVAEEMKERKLAAIMAKMDRGKASEVTTELMQLKELPQLGSVGGG